MRKTAPVPVTTLLALAFACGSARAAAPLYTNKDLERFPSPPAPAGPAAAAKADDTLEDWRLVFEMLDREHARQDADRELQRQRERDTILEKSVEAPRREAVLWPLGWAGFGGFGFPVGPVRPFCRPGAGPHGPRPHQAPPARPGHAAQPR